MTEDKGQEFPSDEYDNRLSQPCLSNDLTHRLTEVSTLEETLETVKERVWSFTDALKGVADILVGCGFNPSILGYSSVSLHEDGYIKEQSEDELALQRVGRNELLCRNSGSGRLLTETMHHRRSSEQASFLQKTEEVDHVNHAFYEAMHRESDERKSLTRSATLESLDDSEFDEDKKDK